MPKYNVSSWLKPLCIGPHTFSNNLALAPMAGVTDRCFRKLCRKMGAAICPSEMITSRPDLQQHWKTQARLDHSGEPGPRIVQIAGGDPAMMATAAKQNVERGADIIDINMGCPAKKVCKKHAGSALLQNPDLVKNILETTVQAVSVPVTLKMRVGWSVDMRNGVEIATIAEQAGIQLLSVHGRTRCDKFSGSVRFADIRNIKQSVSIPVLANGDIRTCLEAQRMFEQTGADGLMIGRAAQGNPWIFEELAHFFTNGSELYKNHPPETKRVRKILLEHLENLYTLYGESRGVRMARKHISWYLNSSYIATLEPVNALGSSNPALYTSHLAELKRAAVKTASAKEQQRFVKRILH